IKYSLIKNRLSTAGVSPYLPKTLLEGSLVFEQFLKALAYGSTATLADVKAVLENLERVCIENLSQGRSVNLGFCTIRPQVKGSFQNLEDSFSQEKNWIEVSIAPNPNFLKKITQDAKLQRVSLSKTLPLLFSLENHTTGLEASLVAGDLVTIHGENLKFDKSVPNVGVFFEGAGVEQRVSEYSKIAGKSISFKVPNGLNPGVSYKLKVKNSFGQEIRTGELEMEIKAA
ncbi:MAG TPA: DNA-binding domain-containing protein, partial [Leptospiraceae bacterium]|nr:DNA-binding domain-containing protein [Leptospiraceae bacterium]